MSDDVTLDGFAEDGNEDTDDQTPQRQHLPEVGELPSNWHLVTVEDIADKIVGGGTPTKSNEEYWGGEIPWASVKDLNGIRLAETEDYITESGVKNSATNLVPADSIIISTRMTVGEPFLNEVDMAINQDMKAIIPDTEQTNSLFAVYSLWDKDPYLKSLGRGTTVDGITTRDLSSTHLGLPSLPEQRKIATVLHTVDQAIQKTEEIVGQRKRVKRGLLQNLFKRGIDTNGNLRSRPSEEPDLFKEEYGRTMPSAWDIKKLADLGEWVSGKTPKRSESSYWGGDIPWITAKDMKSLYVEESEDNITQKAMDEGATIVSPESVLVLVRGMILDHTLPVVRPQKETSFNQDVKAILPNKSVDPDYLAYWLKAHSNEVLALGTSASHGTKRLATDAFGNLAVPIPPEEEQTAMIERISSIGKLVKNETSYIAQLKLLKKGLMQDLLSGKVRTTNTNIEVPEEVAKYG